jgi:MFS family permease
MTRLLAQYRSFDRPVRLLLLNQLSINIGFYMLMPYLAGHLAGDLALAGWAIGLVLGARNFCQQGMFCIGGALADRYGYKPLIVAGCALRTGGFAALGLVDSLPALLVASAATGFAGALFNPAVRAYLAQDAGERRVEAFALFNVFYQTGILAGPLIGLALTSATFSSTCLVAASVFAVLTVVQLRSLPACRAGQREPGEPVSMVGTWRAIIANRSFVLFAVAMIGCYVLSFQVYLALPLQARRLAGPGTAGTVLVAAVFAVSGGLAVAGQVRVTAWCQQRWGRGRCLAVGLALMAAAFLPPALTSTAATQMGWVSLLVCAALLALGTIVVFPFEMETIVALAGNRLVATHYGLYNTVVGVGILLGNLATGTTMDAARSAGAPSLFWLCLAGLGVGCAGFLHALDRRARLEPITV